MWDIYSMYNWEKVSYRFRSLNKGYREFVITPFEFHDDSEETTKKWIAGERWRIGSWSEGQTYQNEMLVFDSYEEAETFLIMLTELLNTAGENETCAVISRYICKKLIQADPEGIQRLIEEEKVYQQALKEKRIREYENAKRLARLKKRNAKGTAAHVYIFSFDDRFCKIGISNNIETRRKTKMNETGRAIQQWAYSEIFPRGDAEAIESRCHEHFAAFRTRGEFFTISFDEACVFLQSQVAKPLTICREEFK